jgi:hypothetical protein
VIWVLSVAEALVHGAWSEDAEARQALSEAVTVARIFRPATMLAVTTADEVQGLAITGLNTGIRDAVVATPAGSHAAAKAALRALGTRERRAAPSFEILGGRTTGGSGCVAGGGIRRRLFALRGLCEALLELGANARELCLEFVTVRSHLSTEGIRARVGCATMSSDGATTAHVIGIALTQLSESRGRTASRATGRI